MAGRNVTPRLSGTHTALRCMMEENKHMTSIQKKKKKNRKRKPEANAKQREVWEEISGSSPKKPI